MTWINSLALFAQVAKDKTEKAGPAAGMDNKSALFHPDDDAAWFVRRAQVGFVHFRLGELER